MPYIKSFYCLLINGWEQENPLTFWKPKGNNSYVAKEIMTKLHVHYSIVTYTQNKILWNMINCSLKPRLHWSHRQSAECQWCESADGWPTVGWFCVRFSCFLGSAVGRNYNWPVVFVFDRPIVFGTWQTIWSRPTVCRLSSDHRSTVGWHSANFYF